MLDWGEAKGQTGQPKRLADFELSPPFKTLRVFQRAEAGPVQAGDNRRCRWQAGGTEGTKHLQPSQAWSSIWTWSLLRAAPSTCLPERSGSPSNSSWSNSQQVSLQTHYPWKPMPCSQIEHDLQTLGLPAVTVYNCCYFSFCRLKFVNLGNMFLRWWEFSFQLVFTPLCQHRLQ